MPLFPPSSPNHTVHNFLIINILFYCGTFVIFDEPVLIKSTIYTRIRSSCRTRFDKCIMSLYGKKVFLSTLRVSGWV